MTRCMGWSVEGEEKRRAVAEILDGAVESEGTVRAGSGADILPPLRLLPVEKLSPSP